MTGTGPPPPHARPETGPTRPRAGCPAGKAAGRAGPRSPPQRLGLSPGASRSPGPVWRRRRERGRRGHPGPEATRVPSPTTTTTAPPAARRPPTPAQPLPHRPRPAPRGPPRPPPRPRPPPALPAPPARRGPRKAGQRARSPQQEILAGLGAAEGAAAPGSGGSGIIFYQRRDQLPHPVTGPYTKAQTDLEKLGRPGGGEGETGRGDGALPCCRPGRRRRDNNQGRRRPPLIGAQKPHTKVPAAAGGGTRRAEGRGGTRRAAPSRSQPAAGREATGVAGGQRFEGRPALTMGCGYYLITQISPTKGARRRDTASVPPAAHARRRGERRGKRGLEAPAMFRPASRPAGAGRCTPARRPWLGPGGWRRALSVPEWGSRPKKQLEK